MAKRGADTSAADASGAAAAEASKKPRLSPRLLNSGTWTDVFADSSFPALAAVVATPPDGVDVAAASRTVQEALAATSVLFPGQDTIPVLDKELSYSPRQLVCLLAHMLVGTWDDVSFVPWLRASANNSAVQLYLYSLLRVLSHPDDVLRAPLVTWRRVQLADVSPPLRWEDRRAGGVVSSSIVTVAMTGAIGSLDRVQVDFANKDPRLGAGGTQEELLFGVIPALCITPLLLEAPLGDNEVLVVSDAPQVSQYSGFGLDARWEGWMPAGTPAKTTLVMDAMYFEPRDTTGARPSADPRQLTPEMRRREATKAFLAFQAVAPSLGPDEYVATGPWGCGAFNGDMEIKAVLQIAAAARAGVRLRYHVFGNEAFAARLLRLVEKIEEHEWTPGDVYGALAEFADSGAPSAFDDLSMD